MFKFELDQTVYFMKDNKVHSCAVLSRMKVENFFPKEQIANEEQRESFQMLGFEREVYGTIFGVYDVSGLFVSRKDLVKYVLGEEV